MDDDLGAGEAEDDRFYVKSLTLENYRCFERLELTDLDPRFNLIIGDNGAGKSSVLLALAELFREIATYPVGAPMGPLLAPTDVNNIWSRLPSSSLTPLRIGLGAWFRWFGQDRSWAEILNFPGFRSGTGNEQSEIWLRQRISHAYPLLTRYSTARQFNRKKNAVENALMPSPPMRWRAFDGWSDAGLSADDLRSWLRDKTLEAYQSSDKTTSTAQALLRDACARSIEGARDIAFVQVRQDIVVYFDDDRELTFEAMSDGQRALVGLVADITMRACVLNFDILGDKCLEETPGLVLIDEIDLHFHPKWQRQIVGALKRIFPKIQFFATTHSPQVIGEARPQEIVLLTKDGQQKRPMGSFGMDSNWILECVMEAEGRNPAVAKRVKALFDLIEDGSFEEARQEIDALRREIGPLAPDIVGAESYLWRIEHEVDEAAE